MSLDFNFTIEELGAAEAATINPYLNSPARGMKLLACLAGYSATESVQKEQRERLELLHKLIHEDFIDLTELSSYSNDARALQHLLAVEEALGNFVMFPDLARKHVVGVGGGFSAGKSRFLNTLLGIDLLPESLEPTTAIPSFIIHGEADIIALNSFNNRVALDRDALLAITHAFPINYRDSLNDSFGFAHILKLLILHQPHLPWENVAFLDTPGYSKADANGNSYTDQSIALRQLGEADYILWLISARNGSIRQDDLDLLRRLNHPQPIYFIITQADLVGNNSIHAVIESIRNAIEQAGIQYAGLMAWTAPLNCDHGERVAGDDLSTWLNSLNEVPKNIQFKSSCQKVLDSYIYYNKESLITSRRKLSLLNKLLPLSDELPDSERITLRQLIHEQQKSQRIFKEQVGEFTNLKHDMVDLVSAIVGELDEAAHLVLSQKQHYQALVGLLRVVAKKKSISSLASEMLHKKEGTSFDRGGKMRRATHFMLR